VEGQQDPAVAHHACWALSFLLATVAKLESVQLADENLLVDERRPAAIFAAAFVPAVRSALDRVQCFTPALPAAPASLFVSNARPIAAFAAAEVPSATHSALPIPQVCRHIIAAGAHAADCASPAPPLLPHDLVLGPGGRPLPARFLDAPKGAPVNALGALFWVMRRSCLVFVGCGWWRDGRLMGGRPDGRPA
jgi:hypothetical protein